MDRLRDQAVVVSSTDHGEAHHQQERSTVLVSTGAWHGGAVVDANVNSEKYKTYLAINGACDRAVTLESNCVSDINGCCSDGSGC